LCHWCEQNKKPKLETANGTFSKKKNVVESEDEIDANMDVSALQRAGRDTGCSPIRAVGNGRLETRPVANAMDPQTSAERSHFTLSQGEDSEEEKPLIKTARQSPPTIAKPEPESSDDDVPLASLNGTSKPPSEADSDLSEEDKPLAKMTKRSARAKASVKSEKTASSDLSAEEEDEAEESSDEDVPLAKKTKKAANGKKAPAAKKKAAEPKKARGKAKKEESDSEDDKPLKARAKGKAAAKAEVKDEKPKGRKKKTEA
jgi:hypothetical protein